MFGQTKRVQNNRIQVKVFLANRCFVFVFRGGGTFWKRWWMFVYYQIFLVFIR